MLRLIFQDDAGMEQSVFLGTASPQVLVGRDRLCDICTARKSVSRNHAEFAQIGADFQVRDLGSSNGTFVNSEPLTGRRTIYAGDEVRCGEMIIRLVHEPEAARSGPPPANDPVLTSAPPDPILTSAPPMRGQPMPTPVRGAPPVSRPPVQPQAAPVAPQRTWTPIVTPAFPVTWPMDVNGHFITYEYSYSHAPGLADGVHIAAPTGMIRRHISGWEERDTLRSDMEDLGVQSMRPLSQDEMRAAEMYDHALSLLYQAVGSGQELAEPNAEVVRAYYNFWMGTNDVIARWAQGRHASFVRWLQDSGGGRAAILEKIDAESRRRIAQGFEYPPGSGRVFSMSPEAQINLLGLQINAERVPYPHTARTLDDQGQVSLSNAQETLAFCEEAYVYKESILSFGRGLKAAVLGAADDAAARGVAEMYLEGGPLPSPQRLSAIVSTVAAPKITAPPAAPAPPARPALTVLFGGKPFVIDKDRFVIGRSPNKTDLTIRDSNISSAHAAVLFKDGQFLIEDLNSTNGIHFDGNQIQSKAIDDNDIFNLCEYELRFVYA